MRLVFVKLSSVEHSSVRGRTGIPKRGEIERVPTDISLVVAVRRAIQGGSRCFKTMKTGGSDNKWHTEAIRRSLSNAKSVLAFMANLYEM